MFALAVIVRRTGVAGRVGGSSGVDLACSDPDGVAADWVAVVVGHVRMDAQEAWAMSEPHYYPWGYLRGLRYRTWARLLHRFDLHHTRRSGPMDDGAFLHRCDWCGVSRTEVPDWVTAKRMADR